MWQKLAGVLLSAFLDSVITAFKNWRAAQEAEANKWTVQAQQAQQQSTADVQHVQFDAGQAMSHLPSTVSTASDLKILFGK